MKKLSYLIYVLTFLTISACSSDDVDPGSGGGCGTHNGKSLNKGPQGGCYYINSNGNKTYVSRSECNC
jgi:hypothetical protein